MSHSVHFFPRARCHFPFFHTHSPYSFRDGWIASSPEKRISIVQWESREEGCPRSFIGQSCPAGVVLYLPHCNETIVNRPPLADSSTYYVSPRFVSLRNDILQLCDFTIFMHFTKETKRERKIVTFPRYNSLCFCVRTLRAFRDFFVMSSSYIFSKVASSFVTIFLIFNKKFEQSFAALNFVTNFGLLKSISITIIVGFSVLLPLKFFKSIALVKLSAFHRDHDTRAMHESLTHACTHACRKSNLLFAVNLIR